MKVFLLDLFFDVLDVILKNLLSNPYNYYILYTLVLLFTTYFEDFSICLESVSFFKRDE